MKGAVALAMLLAFAAAADARSLLQGAKVKCTAGCLPGKCSANGKKCTACADGYVLKPSSGQCACRDGTGSWADQTYETLAGFPASAPNCGVLPATACKCQACPAGYAQTGAGSIPDAACKPVPVDCVATYEACPTDSCQATLTLIANLVEITTPAKYGGKECPATITRTCTYNTPLDCTPTSTCQTSTCQADGTCAAAINKDAGTVCSVTSANDGVCDAAGTCIKNVDCVGSWSEFSACSAVCGGTQTRNFTVTTPAAGAGAACEAADGAIETVACNGNGTPCPFNDVAGAGTCDATGTCVENPVDCVGSWAPNGVCVVADGTCSGVQQEVFSITTPAAGAGTVCEAADGATRNGTAACNAAADAVCSVTSANDGVCDAAGTCIKNVDCVGSWSEFSACSAVCGGTQTRNFTVTTPAAGAGAACEAADGAIETVACNGNGTPCPFNDVAGAGTCDATGTCVENPVDCVGSWAPNGVCVVADGACSGVQQEVFSITTPAAGAGTACEAADGATRNGTAACNAAAATVCSVTSANDGTCDGAGTCVVNPVDCVGTWADNDVCVVADGACSGTLQQVFTVSVPAVGTGACPGNDATQTGNTPCTAAEGAACADGGSCDASGTCVPTTP